MIWWRRWESQWRREDRERGRERWREEKEREGGGRKRGGRESRRGKWVCTGTIITSYMYIPSHIIKITLQLSYYTITIMIESILNVASRAPASTPTMTIIHYIH